MKESSQRTYSIIACLVGNALEYYDVMLYGCLILTITPLFFPSQSPFLSNFLAMSTFCISYLMRPLGALCFGYLGDCFGRKPALVKAILFTTLPALIIGVSPTYEDIGILAPFILISCRLLQGFCIGGEISGAITFTLEQTSPTNKGLVSGFIIASCYLGAFIASILGFIFSLHFIPKWGWRIPFLIGAGIGLLGYVLRSNMYETPAFLKIQSNGNLSKVPLTVFKKINSFHLLQSFIIGGTFTVPFFVIVIYLNNVLATHYEFSIAQSILCNSIVLFSWIIFSPLAGWLTNKYGIKRIMHFSAATLMLVSYPFFWLMNSMHTPFIIIITQIIFSLLSAGINVPSCVLLASFFPTGGRYTGIAVSMSLGAAVFGGLLSFISILLVKYFGHMSIAGFLILNSLTILLITRPIKPSRRRNPFLPHKLIFRKFNKLSSIFGENKVTCLDASKKFLD